MSIDRPPTCPDCGEDLGYEHIKGQWICPTCVKVIDTPEGPLPEPKPE